MGLRRDGGVAHLGSPHADPRQSRRFEGNKKKFLVGFIGTGAVACAALGIPQHAIAFLVFVRDLFGDAERLDGVLRRVLGRRHDRGPLRHRLLERLRMGLHRLVHSVRRVLAVVLGGGAVGIDQMLGMKIAFVITAVWWVAFSIPIIRDVHQTHFKGRAPKLIRSTFSGLWRTIKDIVRDKRICMFMLAYFFYIDGVHTIIKLSTSYGTDLGIDSVQLVLALLVTQFVAFPSAIAYGRLSTRFGTKAHAAHRGVRVFLHHAVRGLLPAKRRGVLDSRHLRGHVPRWYPGAFA